MIKRELMQNLREAAKTFPAVSLTGPRQSGKTTLAKATFPSYEYSLLEDPETRRRAIEDPRRFLMSFKKGVILDEVQRVPELFSYLLGILDSSKKMGRFILTGSQNFLLMEKITQSLAGRVAVKHLLPLSLRELKSAGMLQNHVDEYLYQGMYPPLYDRKINPGEWFSSYISTYLERDVRQIKTITDLNLFQKFMGLCAGRSGQLLNVSELGNDCGVSHTTARSWLSILETSFVIFRLQPYFRNMSKRLVKQPKLYFYDTGLLCALMGIQKREQLENHPLRGAIFETFIVSEMMKFDLHEGRKPNSFFWRDNKGNEVDYIIEKANHLIPIEMKAGETVNEDFFKSLKYIQAQGNADPESSYIIYGGEESKKWKNGKVISWKHLEKLWKEVQ